MSLREKCKPKNSFRLKGRVIFFATDNVHKFNEARTLLSESDLSVGMLRVKAFEIQNENLEKIAKSSATDAFRRAHLPIIVEDAGLFIEALNGFPGPYTAYAYKTIGNQGLLKLMDKIHNRTAAFQSVIVYRSAETETEFCFRGEAKGEITYNEKSMAGQEEFGFDPIFRPSSSSKTFAQMSIAEKNKFSHRAMALREFARWYTIPAT